MYLYFRLICLTAVRCLLVLVRYLNIIHIHLKFLFSVILFFSRTQTKNKADGHLYSGGDKDWDLPPPTRYRNAKHLAPTWHFANMPTKINIKTKRTSHFKGCEFFVVQYDIA